MRRSKEPVPQCSRKAVWPKTETIMPPARSRNGARTPTLARRRRSAVSNRSDTRSATSSAGTPETRAQCPPAAVPPRTDPGAHRIGAHSPNSATCAGGRVFHVPARCHRAAGHLSGGRAPTRVSRARNLGCSEFHKRAPTSDALSSQKCAIAHRTEAHSA
jgi:hypothetical protein